MKKKKIAKVMQTELLLNNTVIVIDFVFILEKKVGCVCVILSNMGYR